VRVAALGKKGSVNELLKSLGGMSADERREKGPLFNGLRDRAAEAIAKRKIALGDQALNARLAQERIDVTLPTRPEAQGTIHPVSQVLDEITAIFADLGFSIAEGPDVEFDDYNFTKLNIPPDHPARQMHDTFYLARQAAGSGAHNAGAEAADPRHRAGTYLSPRFRRDPHADVPPAGSTGDRRRHQPRQSQMGG
jgi:phenylalanyl-tRNA synthetase alpha chain